MLTHFLKTKTFIQFFKFLFVGGSAFLIDFSINVLIVSLLNLEIKIESVIANIISYSVALIYNYTLSSRWSFKSEEGDKRGIDTMIKFVMVNLFNLTWSSIAIWYLVGVISYMDFLPNEDLIQPFTKLLVTSFMVVVSFVLYRKFVFNKKQRV